MFAQIFFTQKLGSGAREAVFNLKYPEIGILQM
jgi:hypothetical protein